MAVNMSTATLPREARRNAALFTQPPNTGGRFKMYAKAAEGGNAVLVIEGMQVFRSGTFRDSMGYQHTWEPLHIEEMVRNFDYLRSRGILPHVPVRKGHPGFLTTGGDIMDSVLGYHTKLEAVQENNPVDGRDYTYLLADYEILGPAEAIEAIQSGRWRNMSSEVGTWVSNDEAEYWPVYQGVAYVDFSAVEGLKNFASANGVGSTFSIISEETSVSQSTLPGQQTPPAAPVPPPVVTPPAAPAAETQQHSAPQPPAPAPAPAFEFTLSNGSKTTDFAAVQAELQALGTFKKESIESGRKLFAKELVDTNKILAKDLEQAEAYCLSLNDEQFTAYKALMGSVAPSPVVGQVHAEGTSNHSGTSPVGEQSKAPDEFETALETIKQFQMSGMKPDQIKATPTYAKLAAANKAPF